MHFLLMHGRRLDALHCKQSIKSSPRMLYSLIRHYHSAREYFLSSNAFTALHLCRG